MPLPSLKPVMALPRIAPAALAWSLTFIAWPGVLEVVSMSPGLMAPVRGIRLHIDAAGQRHVLAALDEPLLVHLDAGVDAVGTADDASHPGVIRTIAQFQVPGVLLINHHDGALRNFAVTRGDIERLRQVGAAADGQGGGGKIVAHPHITRSVPT